jgi:hypothetical protein
VSLPLVVASVPVLSVPQARVPSVAMRRLRRTRAGLAGGGVGVGGSLRFVISGDGTPGQQRGEASVALARLIACSVFLAMHLPARAQALLLGDLKSWLIITSLVIGLGFSLVGLRWARLGTVTALRLRLSMVIDAVVVYVTLGAGGDVAAR